MPGPAQTPSDRQTQGRPEDDPPEDRYDPSSVEATRDRSQGLGVGERDLERQRDPQRPVSPAGEEDRPDGE
jgi:hypothetical protein